MTRGTTSTDSARKRATLRTIYLSIEDDEMLMRLAREQGISVSALIRAALRAYAPAPVPPAPNDQR